MSSKNQIRQDQKNKFKKNKSKLYQLKPINNNTANISIINLDTTSTSSNSSTDNINSDISISESDKSIKQLSTPSINSKKPVSDEKRVLMLSRLSKPSKLMPNSVIMSLLTQDKTSGYMITDNELDRTQWELESIMSSILQLKNTIKDNRQSLSSISLADYQKYGFKKISQRSVVDSEATTEILPINQFKEMNDDNNSSGELSESSLESTEPINSKPDESFWTFAKPYLAHVGKEELNWLKGRILSYDENLAEIPPLNDHYTKVWTREKLSTENNQPLDHTWQDNSIQPITPNVIDLVNKVNQAAYDGNILTPIFQRVVSALSENLNTSENDNIKENIEYERIEDQSQDLSNFCKQFYREKNVKNQLLNLGLTGRHSKTIFPPSISQADSDVDEILAELIQCDIALMKLQEGNKHDLIMLFQKCFFDYRKQKIKNKINKVNSKILKFKKQLNKNLKRKKNAQIAKENNKLRSLLDQRNKYLSELRNFMHSKVSKVSYLNASFDSSSSDEESISI